MAYSHHMNAAIAELVHGIYPDERADRCMGLLTQLLDSYRDRVTRPAGPDASPATSERGSAGLPLDEADSIVITYGDQFRGPDGPPLAYLDRFLREELDGYATGVHILPFSPYSSDDGFSVRDYRAINPDLGGWDEVTAIAGQFRLMADLVLNHCSAHSDWFQAYLEGHAPYDRYFISVPPGTDTSTVARPRSLPLLTPFQTASGEKLVWTTFSADQVDLNFAEPAVLLEMLDILLLYVEKGAQLIRLDAIAYLWKELGTACLHHPNTHRVVQLFRAVLDEIAPWVIIITETNVPHEENISYFGDGRNEAHMVYNFSLPPLTLDAVLREDTGHLQRWARGLPAPSRDTAFFNFLASHDGIGLLPTHGILSEAERLNLIETVQQRGGRISFKSTANGEIPYEMNVNYLSAVADPNLPDDQRARAFLVSQSIMLCLAGVPGIYIHSLLGSTNWTTGVEQTGMNRAINRCKLNYPDLVQELNDGASLRHRVFEGYKQLLRARSRSSAFHPAAEQDVLATEPQIFAVLRHNTTEQATVLCLHNVSGEAAEVTVPRHCFPAGQERSFTDLVSGDIFFPYWTDSGDAEITLEPHEVMWLNLA